MANKIVVDDYGIQIGVVIDQESHGWHQCRAVEPTAFVDQKKIPFVKPPKFAGGLDLNDEVTRSCTQQGPIHLITKILNDDVIPVPVTEELRHANEGTREMRKAWEHAMLKWNDLCKQAMLEANSTEIKLPPPPPFPKGPRSQSAPPPPAPAEEPASSSGRSPAQVEGTGNGTSMPEAAPPGSTSADSAMPGMRDPATYTLQDLIGNDHVEWRGRDCVICRGEWPMEPRYAEKGCPVNCLFGKPFCTYHSDQRRHDCAQNGPNGGIKPAGSRRLT